MSEKMEMKLLKVQYEREKKLVEEKVRELASFQHIKDAEVELRERNKALVKEN